MTRRIAPRLASAMLALAACALLGPAMARPAPLAPSLAGLVAQASDIERLIEARDWTSVETRLGAEPAPTDRASRTRLVDLHQQAADGLLFDGRLREAERHYLAALGLVEGADAPDPHAHAKALNALGNVRLGLGEYEEAQKTLLAALDHAEKVGQDDDFRRGIRGAIQLNLAASYSYLDAVEESERRYWLAIGDLEYSEGSLSIAVAVAYHNLAELLKRLGRDAEASWMFGRAADVASYHPEDPQSVGILIGTADFALETGQVAAAKAHFASATEVVKDLPRRDAQVESVLDRLRISILLSDGASDQAVAGLRALKEKDARVYGPESLPVALDLAMLSDAHALAEDFAAAERSMRESLAIYEKKGGIRAQLAARETVAALLLRQERPGDALKMLRPACAERARLRGRLHLDDQALDQAKRNAGTCGYLLARALIRHHGPNGRAPRSAVGEAFLAAQQAEANSAAAAINHASAKSLALARGAGPAAIAYENALAGLGIAQAQLARASVVAGQAGVEARERLTNESRTRERSLAQIEQQLKQEASAYWLYRSGEPVTLDELQGSGTKLLRAGEALVLWVTPRGARRGLVFAVNRDRVGWAEIPLTTDKVTSLVKDIRRSVDSCAGLPVSEPCPAEAPRTFDRGAAYRLYQALLGDGDIQRVIAAASTLVVIPSAELSSLPPGLLLTKRPAESLEADSNPDVLRESPWLIVSKAVTVMPSVSSLKALRRQSRGRAAGSGRVLAFADPDFNDKWLEMDARRRAAPESVECGAVRSVLVGAEAAPPVGLARVLDGLDPLPCTRREALALAGLAGAPRGDVVLGRSATLAELQRRSQEGQLRQADIVLLATHALLAGEESGIREPALVLAGRGEPSQRLLTASDAALLVMNADWVVLSACNTAAPDGEADGVSGLTRALMYAGARAVLISHWQVRDDLAADLTPRIVALAGQGSKAEALRAASLEILRGETSRVRDEPDSVKRKALRDSLAHPAAWAVFTLVGA